MPIFDLGCTACAYERPDTLVRADGLPACPVCGAPTQKLFRVSAAVVGDECDFVTENLGPVPMHFTSKTAWRAEMQKRGVFNRVEHKPTQGSDRSPFTSRWI